MAEILLEDTDDVVRVTAVAGAFKTGKHASQYLSLPELWAHFRRTRYTPDFWWKLESRSATDRYFKSPVRDRMGCFIRLIAAFSAALFMTKSGFDRWQWSALAQILTLLGPNLLGGQLGEEAGSHPAWLPASASLLRGKKTLPLPAISPFPSRPNDL